MIGFCLIWCQLIGINFDLTRWTWGSWPTIFPSYYRQKVFKFVTVEKHNENIHTFWAIIVFKRFRVIYILLLNGQQVRFFTSGIFKNRTHSPPMTFGSWLPKKIIKTIDFEDCSGSWAKTLNLFLRYGSQLTEIRASHKIPILYILCRGPQSTFW